MLAWQYATSPFSFVAMFIVLAHTTWNTVAKLPLCIRLSAMHAVRIAVIERKLRLVFRIREQITGREKSLLVE